MDFFYKLDYKEIIALLNLLTLMLAEDKSQDELNILGNFIVSLGGNLLTIAAVKQFTADKISSTNNNSANNNT